MPARKTIRSMLSSGRHRNSSGRTAEVVELVRANPKRASQLLECLWDEEPAVAMRAADALEKLTRLCPHTPDPAREPLLGLLQRSWKPALIGLLAEATENKLRWSLAAMVPRLAFTVSERERVAETLRSYLEDRSSIVKTCALQGLADLARQDGSCRLRLVEPELLDDLLELAMNLRPFAYAEPG